MKVKEIATRIVSSLEHCIIAEQSDVSALALGIADKEFAVLHSELLGVLKKIVDHLNKKIEE